MAVGDVRIIDGVEFEVVWDGGEGLTADRVTKSLAPSEPPKRLYNKKSDYWTTPRVKKVNYFGEEDYEVQETSNVQGNQEAKDPL